MLQGMEMPSPVKPKTPPRRDLDPDNIHTATGQSFRVLIVEDDIELARLTAEYLGKKNIDVLIEHRGDEALARIATEKPDLIVLDVMLPGMDGFDICRALRRQGTTAAEVPIIMLTARDEDIDQVLGLEMGADDYLTKPVLPRVLLAHIKAILRRASTLDQAAHDGDALHFGQLRISKPSRDVTLGDRQIDRPLVMNGVTAHHRCVSLANGSCLELA